MIRLLGPTLPVQKNACGSVQEQSLTIKKQTFGIEYLWNFGSGVDLNPKLEVY